MAPVVIFILLVLAGLPIGLVMALAGLGGAVSFGGLDYLEILPDRFYAGVSSFVLIAIPYFVFTAELMNRAKLTDRLISFASSLFGRVPGALSHVNVATSVFFAGITGAAVTDTVALGKTLIPAMKRQGYSAEYSAAITACSSIIGPIIPPSIIMVVYAATLRDLSVVDLFIAGLAPGALMGGMLLVTSGLICWRRGYAANEALSFSRIWHTGVAAIGAMVIPAIILGGILTGITTVTEAAALGAIYALAIGMLGYRTLGWTDLRDSLVSTVRFCGVVFLLLGASAILGWFVTRSGWARETAELIAFFSEDAWVQLLVVIALLVVLGAFVDVLPAIVVAAPVLAPAMVQLGFDPLHFGIVMLLALNLGNITPPVGMTLMVASKIAGVRYERAVVASLPFLTAHLAVLVLVASIPALSLSLPTLYHSLS